jgi:hypothetical protein
MELLLPIAWNAPRRAGHGLARRMPTRGCQMRRIVDAPLRLKIVEPRFTRFEARDDGVLRLMKVLASVLVRRAVAASDMPARRAAPKVQPPGAACEAFDASGPARFRALNDLFATFCHVMYPRIHSMHFKDRGSSSYACTRGVSAENPLGTGHARTLLGRQYSTIAA